MERDTFIESARIGEAEELALMVGRGVQHPQYPVVIRPGDTDGWEFWVGTRLLRCKELAPAIAEFNRIVEALDRPEEKCLKCGEEVVTQDGVYRRDMNTGEILYIEKIRQEWCTKCGTDHHLTSRLRK